MKLRRRQLLQLAAGAAALPIVSRRASALDYPTQPLRIIVGFPAGLAPDVIARVVGEPLSQRLGQAVIIENRPGAGANIGAEAVVRAPPDGYTLLLASTTNAINTTLYKKLNFNFVDDIAPVAGIGRGALVLVVHPALPAKTVPEFIAYAKAHPGKINMASPGTGTTPHVFGELFKMKTGVDLPHIPYRSSFYPDLLGGHVEVSFVTVITSVEYIRTGRLRVLGVTTARPVEALPDVSPIGKFVPGYEASAWFGIGAPRRTPVEIIDKLTKDIKEVVADPKMNARLVGLGVEAMSMTSAEFGKFIADETEKWAAVVKFAGIEPV
jgi:tripartite-type tricarboxylate transporter receptor subunit TctC